MATFRCEYVRCGKPSCRSCPHGPYWYAYWREGKRVRKRYVGKDAPEELRPGVDQVEEERRLDRIFSRKDATLALALEILQGGPNSVEWQVRAAFRRLSLETHPDRGGSEKACARVNAAWSFIRAAKGWK